MTARKSRNKRIDLRLKGVGRLRVSAGTNQRREYERRKQVLRDLHGDGRLDVLCALRDGKISMVEVLASSRETGVRSLDAIVLHRPLWPAVDDAMKDMDIAAETRLRYTGSLKKLRECGVIAAKAKVRDLESVRWPDVRPHFAGPSDWNNLRRTLSVVLSAILGDKMHPYRRQVVTQLAWEQEREVTPDIDVPTFWSVVERLPVWARDPVTLLALTGVRVGEYIYADERDLRAVTLEWVVRGKGRRTRTVSVAAEAWPLLCAAVPARYAPPPLPGQRNSATRRYQLLQGAWATATKAAGVSCTLHGLRHLNAQLASDLGKSDGAIADGHGHADAKTTRRYTKRTSRRDVAEGTAAVILRRA
jgi:integrase